MPAVTVTKGVKVDADALNAHLRDYSLALGKSLSQTIREQSGLFCQDMISYSRPFANATPGSGATSQAKKTGETIVEWAIFKIFRPLDKADKAQVADVGRADVFKMWERRNGAPKSATQKKGLPRWITFQKRHQTGSSLPFIESGQMGKMEQIHNSLRTDNGHGWLTPAAKRARRPFAIVKSESDIKRYAKMKQKDVGTLKSAYYYAATTIRSNVRAPAWVRHEAGRSNAIAIDNSGPKLNPEITVGNTIGAKAGNDRFVQIAVSYRAYAMRVAMAAKFNKEKMPLWLATAQGRTTGGTNKYFYE